MTMKGKEELINGVLIILEAIAVFVVVGVVVPWVIKWGFDYWTWVFA